MSLLHGMRMLCFYVHCPAMVSGGGEDEMMNLPSSSPGAWRGSAPNSPSLLPHGDFAWDCFLSSDLDLPRDAIFGNICLAPPGYLCDSPGQHPACHLPAKMVQTTALITARKGDWGTLARPRPCVWLGKAHDEDPALLSFSYARASQLGMTTFHCPIGVSESVFSASLTHSNIHLHPTPGRAVF